MKAINILLIVLSMAFATVSITGCNKQQTPAEVTADAVEDAGDVVEDGADEAGDAIEDLDAE